MNIKLVLARMGYNPEITWTETKTVEVFLPINQKDDWEVIGAEWPIEKVPEEDKIGKDKRSDE